MKYMPKLSTITKIKVKAIFLDFKLTSQFKILDLDEKNKINFEFNLLG